MADYYAYIPCPGSTGTQFYSNVAPTYPGAFIRFDSGSDPLQYGKCFHVAPVTLETPPTPLVSINWTTVVYSFWNDKCDSCIEQAPCGDCPPGYTLVDGECILTESVPANYTGGLVPVIAGSEFSGYTKFGLRLYPDISGLTLPLYGYGYADIVPVPCTITIPYSVKDNNGAGVTVTPLLSSVKSKLWGCDNSIPSCQTGTSIGNRGRLMETGIWSPGYPDDTELSFEFCVDIDSTKQYLIGIAGDNKVKIYVDSVLHVFLDVDGVSTCIEAVTTPFTSWHVFPITLNTGNHIIKLSGLNLGSQASFGAEIYDIDLATFQSTLTTAASGAPNCGNVPADIDPYVIFSTKDYIGQNIPDPADPGVWTCPDGYTLDYCNGIPQCTKITTIPVIPCAYQLTSCCDSSVYLASLIDLPESTTNIVVGNNAGSSIPVGCYSVLPYTGTGSGIPVFQYDINYSTGSDCNSSPFICNAYCGICKCTRVKLKPEYVTPGSPDVLPLLYWTCELTVIDGITSPISATLNVPLDGSWTDYVCASDFYTFLSVFDFEESGDCKLDIATDTYECPKYYQIVNCQDSLQVICVSNDLSSEFASGSSIQVSAYPEICWYIEELETPCDSPVTVVVTQSFVNCATCEETLKAYYKLVNCIDPLVVVYTETDLSASVGSIIAVNEYPDDCWSVEVSALAVSPVDVTGVIEFASCEECGRQFYLLEDCNTENPEPNIITSTDLSLYVGQVITLEYCPDICWQVSETDVSSQNEVVNITGLYATCEICQIAVLPCVCSRVTNNTLSPGLRYNYYDCNGVSKFTPPLAIGQTSPKVCAKLWVNAPDVEYFGDCIDEVCPDDSRPKKSIRPGYNTPGCTPEKYEKTMCNFSEGIYKQVVSKIYGVTTCCGDDDYKWEIRKELIELKAIEDPNYTCQLTGTCGCNGSSPGLTPCVPDPNPPIVCHLYSIMIKSLTGSSFTYRNCLNELVAEDIQSTKAPYEVIVCGIAGQTIQQPVNVLIFTVTETSTTCT